MVPLGAVLAAVGRVQPTVKDVTSARLIWARALALRRLGRLAESSTAFEVAAKLAEELGWLYRAADLHYEAGMSAYDAADFRAALRLGQRELSLQEQHGSRAGVAGGHRSTPWPVPGRLRDRHLRGVVHVGAHHRDIDRPEDGRPAPAPRRCPMPDR